MSRPRGQPGYVLAEALVSAALATLAGVLAVTLLIWSAESIERSQSSLGAIRVLGRLYEESRLASPDALGRPASGVIGRYQWVRAPSRPLGEAPGLALDPQFADSPMPVRFSVQWTAAGRPQRQQLQAIVRPAAEASAP